MMYIFEKPLKLQSYFTKKFNVKRLPKYCPVKCKIQD